MSMAGSIVVPLGLAESIKGVGAGGRVTRVRRVRRAWNRLGDAGRQEREGLHKIIPPPKIVRLTGACGYQP